MRSLKEMVVFPLLYPELFQKFKVNPPRGVLFHGPPGMVAFDLTREMAMINIVIPTVTVITVSIIIIATVMVKIMVMVTVKIMVIGMSIVIVIDIVIVTVLPLS